MKTQDTTGQQHEVTFRISHRLDFINAYCECGFETGYRNVKEFGGIQPAKQTAHTQHDEIVQMEIGA
jgi:hypothetical protein